MNIISRAFKPAALSVDMIERDTMWRTMRYKIGKRFMALDVAGNPCFYYSYKRSRVGGWGPITIADLNTPDATRQGGFTLLVDRHPMHVKCVPALEEHLKSLRAQQADADKEWTEVLKRRHADIIDGFEKEDAATAAGTTSTKSPDSKMPDQPPPICLKYGMWKALRNKRVCRLSRVRTFLYKSVYFTLMGIGMLAGLFVYRRFKAWLNPPARQGLTNIENSVLFYPRQLLAWLTVNVFVHVLGVLDSAIDYIDGTELGSKFIDALFNFAALFEVSTSDAEYYSMLERKEHAQRQTQQSNRLRELFGFLFLLFFVLLIL